MGGRKMLKKTAIFLLICLLTISSTAFGMGNNIQTVKPHEKLQKKSLQSINKLDEQMIANDEKVRVVVELNEKPTIEIAQKQGVKFDQLEESTKNQLEDEALENQQEVKKEIKDKNIDATYLNDFTTVVNGFSAEVRYGEINMLEKMKKVKKVHIVNEYERPVVKPEMKYSKEIVEAQKAWQSFHYQGDKLVVGIIDTGLDVNHQDMTLSDHNKAKLIKKDVEKTIKENNMPGKFFTEKVPYGYNYMDQNDEVRDIGPSASMHGMHVGGIVGANGDDDNGGIKGVAPEVQLLALKVFGNDPTSRSTYSDVYVKAIDDAIKLGADVLNLSLGSPAGFVSPDDPEQQAVKRAVENGVLMSISAGNAALFGDGYFYPYTANPDYGVNGSPGVSYESLQVASIENTFMDIDAVEYNIEGSKGSAAFLSAGKVHPNDYVQKTFALVDVGLATEKDFKGKDVKGKFALAQRGEIAFTDKVLNAQAAGAEGIIIYNNADGVINMATNDNIKIPQLFMLKNDGEKLSNALKEKKEVTVSFPGKSKKIVNPDEGKMSDFTSWGTPPNLDFKPEITAPGGQILSTLNDNQYGYMSGTSMAAPHVSGGGALVLQRIDEDFQLHGSERVHLAKNMMMNTAKTVTFDGAPVSPRRQGSGLMQIHAALATPVVITEKQTNEAKVALKEITDNIASFTLTAENFTDEEITYEVNVNAQVDTPIEADSMLINAPNMFGATELSNVAKADKESVKVPANGKAEIEITIEVNDELEKELQSIYPNGYWLEGFVTLIDPSDHHPQLTVPYIGFKGEWDQAPIVDSPLWADDSFYEATGIVTASKKDTFTYLGIDPQTKEVDPNRIAFSPNGDGEKDNAFLALSLLRNAKEVKFNVLNDKKEKIRTIRSESYLKKNYFDGGSYPHVSVNPATAWDGKINGKIAEEGQYYLQVEAIIDYPGAKWKTFELPIKLDVTGPTIQATYDKDTHTVTVQANDQLSGLSHWEIFIDDESVAKGYTSKKTEHALKKKPGPKQTLKIEAVDHAGNVTTEFLKDADNDNAVPAIYLLKPTFAEVFNKKTITFNGYVVDHVGLQSVTVDGKKAALTYNKEEKRYDFEKRLKIKKDGVHDIRVIAENNQGEKSDILRKVIVDTRAPDLQIRSKKYTVDQEISRMKVPMTVKDNFDAIRVYVNGEEVYKHDYTAYQMKPFHKKINDIEVNLEDGHNHFEFKVVDLGGNETIKNINIYRSNKKPKRFKDVVRNHWAKEAIQTLHVMGVINGKADGNFGPNDHLTRMQAAQMIARALELDLDDRPDPTFPDVGEKIKKYDPEGYKAIAAVAAEGIMTGDNKGNFNPKAPLKRQELAKIIVEAFQLKGKTKNTFKDVPKTHWAAKYVNKLVANEITKGYPDQTFKLNNYTSRAEFALFFARVFDDRFKAPSS